MFLCVTGCGRISGCGGNGWHPGVPVSASCTCLWHSVFGSRRAHVILIRERCACGCDLALVTIGTTTVIERYAARWSIEVAFEDARQAFGTGQARNRTAGPVRRTVPWCLRAFGDRPWIRSRTGHRVAAWPVGGAARRVGTAARVSPHGRRDPQAI